MVKKLIIFIIFLILTLPLVGRTEDPINRVKYFISLYCKTYESKNLNKFKTFFASDAKENNMPFHELLSKYARNLEKVESFYYWIELSAYSLEPDTGNVKIKGKFFTQFRLHEGAMKENSGNISMELMESGESYLVKRLDYGN